MSKVMLTMKAQDSRHVFRSFVNEFCVIFIVKIQNNSRWCHRTPNTFSYQNFSYLWRHWVIGSVARLSLRNSFARISLQLTSDALVMLVATELRVGDIADDATSDGLAVMLLNLDWNKNGKLLLDPNGPDECSTLWPFVTTSLALWLIVDPFRFEMWFKSRKFVLLLDIGELHVVGGCDFEATATGDSELCCATV